MNYEETIENYYIKVLKLENGFTNVEVLKIDTFETFNFQYIKTPSLCKIVLKNFDYYINYDLIITIINKYG